MFTIENAPSFNTETITKMNEAVNKLMCLWGFGWENSEKMFPKSYKNNLRVAQDIVFNSYIGE